MNTNDSSVRFGLILLFGAAVGALVVLGSRSSEVPPGLLPSITAVAVGWWINYAIRRQAELERVPLTYISDLSKQIDDLVSTCLEVHLGNPTVRQLALFHHAQPTNKQEGVIKLRKLANELHFFITISPRSKDSRLLTTKLRASYLEFKAHLTGEEQPDLAAASTVSHRLRMLVLELHRHICRQILDQDGQGPLLRR